MSKYAWIIATDTESDLTVDRLGQVGPKGAHEHWSVEQILDQGRRFRLLNADAKVRFIGVIAGRISGAEPLEEFGEALGCKTIEYVHEGEWRRFRRKDGG